LAQKLPTYSAYVGMVANASSVLLMWSCKFCFELSGDKAILVHRF